MHDTKFSRYIDPHDNLYFVSDFVFDNQINEEYIQLFYYFDFFYSRTTKNSGIYMIKFYYK